MTELVVVFVAGGLVGALVAWFILQWRTRLPAALAPVQSSLEDLHDRIQQLEVGNATARGQLSEQMRAIGAAQEDVRRSTSELSSALRNPVARGHWGEMQLERVLTLAGLRANLDYSKQETARSDEGSVRPDVVVFLPGGRSIVVDSKAPLADYFEAAGTRDRANQAECMRHFAARVRAHIKALGGKRYWTHVESAVDLTVVFLPGECFFSAAAEADPRLIEDAISQGVLIATPTTLLGLLRAVAYGWREERITDNAREISRLGRELHDRVAKFAEHLAKVGLGLGRAAQAYNDAVGCLESRVIPSARILKEKGITASSEFPSHFPAPPAELREPSL